MLCFAPNYRKIALFARSRCDYNANVLGRKPSDMAQTETDAVLILDEDPVARRLAGAIVRAQNYAVFEAWEWKGAKALLRRNAAGLVLLDIRMEQASHGRLVSRLKKSYPGLRVIFTYRPEDEDAVRRSASMAAATCLPKPFTPLELCRAVQSCLGRPGHRALPSVA